MSNELKTVFTYENASAFKAADDYYKLLQKIAALESGTGKGITPPSIGTELPKQIEKISTDFLTAEKRALSLATAATRLANIPRGQGFDYLTKSAEAAAKEASKLQTNLRLVSVNAARTTDKSLLKILSDEADRLKTRLVDVDRRLTAIRQADTAQGFRAAPSGPGGPGGGSGNSTFLSSLSGGLLGAGAAGAAIVAANEVKQLGEEVVGLGVKAVKLSGDFEITRNSMEVFTGSTRLANAELAGLAKLSQDTPGLRLQDAEQGATRLRALGFEAQTARDLVVGLSKQKLLSGADEGAIQRSIINLTQIGTGSTRLTQDIKELVLALPTSKSAIEQTFGSIEKFKTAIKDDPDSAIKKFAEGLKNVQVPAAGLNDALGKAEDAAIQAGRAFGQPILDPLTKDVKDLTAFLNENRDTFTDWGQHVADVVRGTSDIVRGAKSADDSTGGFFSKLLGITASGTAAALLGSNGAAGGLIGTGASTISGLGDLGALRRQIDESKKTFDKQFPLFGDKNLRDDFTVDLTNVESDGERQTRELEATKKQLRQEEKNRLETIESLKQSRKTQSSINENYYKVEEARLTSHLDTTKDQELETLKLVSNLRQTSFTDQIDATKVYYQSLILFGKLSDKELIETERDRDKELRTLGAQAAIQALNAQKEIAAKEKEVFEQRKQLTSDFKDLVADSLSSSGENKLVKYFTDANKAIASTFEKFKPLGTEFANMAAGITRDAEQKKFNLQLLDSQAAALKLRQEARRLAELPENQTNGFQRRLGALEQGSNLISRATGFRRDARLDRALANGFDPEKDPLFDVKETLRSIGGAFGVTGRLQKLAGQLGGLGVEGRGVIAQAQLNNLPSREELLALRKGGLNRGDFGAVAGANEGLAARSRAESALADVQEKQLKDLLQQQKFAEGARRDAQDQVDLLRNAKGLSRDQSNDRLLSITDDLGPGELTPELRRARIDALTEKSNLEDAQRRQLSGFIDKFNRLTNEGGLPVAIKSGRSLVEIRNKAGRNAVVSTEPNEDSVERKFPSGN